VYLRFRRLTIRGGTNYDAFSLKMRPALPFRPKFRWFLAAATALLAAVFLFLHAGSFLVREDPLEKAQYVAVLSGGLPGRALAGAELFRLSGASEVWLTRPLQPGAAMAALRLPYAGEEEYSRMVLIDKGVPPARIRILNSRISNTADELKALSSELEAVPGATVIVVTSGAHTRRVRAIWRSVGGSRSRNRLLVRSAPEDSFDAAHWWRTTNDALTVVREYLGLLNVWAGFPLKRAP
jgi:uncharacterized SAM-binding protein YcdF (DUF218 family)